VRGTWTTTTHRSPGWWIVLLATAGGALGALTALAAGAAGGMAGAELGHLAVLFGVGMVATAVGVAVSARLLARATLGRRLAGVALVSALAGLANLGALAGLMLVDERDALLIAILLLYSLGAGAGTALALARPSAHAVEQAVEAQRRDLITAVSHDLRTPLASLRAMIEAIDEGVVDDAETVRRYASEMRRSVGALTLLVDDLFELIQLDSATLEAEASTTLDEALGTALAACGSGATEKRLRLVTYLDGAGGAPCSPRMGRVLQNLLQNAIRHTPADGTVRVEARRAAGVLEVCVEDDGEGISPDCLPLVFDPFWRGDAARTGSGSGLGLTLAKRIVESLGGQIRAASEPAKGSRFAVMIPERGGQIKTRRATETDRIRPVPPGAAGVSGLATRRALQ
jgi:signal transduction histidine kinase